MGKSSDAVAGLAAAAGGRRSGRAVPALLALAAALGLAAAGAPADCLTDIDGEVYCGAGRCLADSKGTVFCSRFYEGGVVRTLDGEVLCGKGQCAQDSRGEVYCSNRIGGSAVKDNRGRVRCYGECEPGSPQMCETTVAGSAGS